MGKNIGSGKTDRIVQALLEQPTVEKAALAAGVSEATVWRWLRKPEFRLAFATARRDAFSRSLARLQNASTAAVGTLLRVMVDKDTPAATKVRAADSVLEHAANAFELEDLELRLSRLEAIQEAEQ